MPYMMSVMAAFATMWLQQENRTFGSSHGYTDRILRCIRVKEDTAYFQSKPFMFTLYNHV